MINTPASNQTVTLTNSGNAALTIGSLALGGATPAAFTIISQTCATVLAAGSSCTVTIGFTQNTAGSYSATLTAADNATPPTQTVLLMGTVSGIASATLTPSTLAFTSVAGTTSAAQILTLTNTGSAALTIGSMALGRNESHSVCGNYYLRYESRGRCKLHDQRHVQAFRGGRLYGNAKRDRQWREFSADRGPEWNGNSHARTAGGANPCYGELCRDNRNHPARLRFSL